MGIVIAYATGDGGEGDGRKGENRLCSTTHSLTHIRRACTFTCYPHEAGAADSLTLATSS